MARRLVMLPGLGPLKLDKASFRWTPERPANLIERKLRHMAGDGPFSGNRAR